MIFITHDLELAAAVCDRTAVMYAGQIVELRESDRLHDDPLHPYTAALVGCASRHRPRPPTGCCAIPGRPLSAFEAPAAECAFSHRAARTSATCAAVAYRRSIRSTPAHHAASGPRELRGRLGTVVGMTTPVLAGVDALRKEFGDLVAVDDVSFTVPAGRISGHRR